MSDLKHVRVQVYGIVQGVGFRYFTQQQAQKLNISGHATNLSDGSVEVIAQGEQPSVDTLIEWLKTGPRSASVDFIEVTDLDISTEMPNHFRAY